MAQATLQQSVQPDKRDFVTEFRGGLFPIPGSGQEVELVGIG